MTKPIRWQTRNQRLGQLDAITVIPEGIEPSHLVVLCHGYGAPGDDLAGLADLLVQQAQALEIRPAFIFPAAPIDLSDEGMWGCRAWWRLNMARLMQATMSHSFDALRAEIPDGIDVAREKVCELIDQARRECVQESVPLVLGGFSQGAMLAVDVSLRGLKEPPVGLILFSGALICEPIWQPLANRLKNTPIYQSHGTLDPILPIETGRWLGEMFSNAGCVIQQHFFAGPHTIPMQAIQGCMKTVAAVS